MLRKILSTVPKILENSRVFYVAIGLLVLQALWFALTVQYPMAFDEQYHFGIIRFYSDQLSPFFLTQPVDSEAFGDLTRYGSYMFHYLMSFPYRIVAPLTDSLYAQVVILRLMNIALFVAGMFAFRRLLQGISISNKLINFSMLMLVLIPIVPFLAGTINYDNLAFLLVPLYIGLVIKSDRAIKSGKLSVRLLVTLVAFGVFGSLVKYAFLTIFAITLLYLAVVWVRSTKRGKILEGLVPSFTRESGVMKIALIVIALTSIGLFAERYGINFIQYHKYQPTCSAVRPVSECMMFGPWGRDFIIKESVAVYNPPHDPPIHVFPFRWIDDLTYRMYFAVNYDYATKEPFPLPLFVAMITAKLGIVLCIVFWRSIIHINRYVLLFGVISAFYIGSLFYLNFTAYLGLRTIVAANGRYLIIILPLVFVLLGLAYQQLLRRFLRRYATALLGVIVVLALGATLNGGGAMTHLLRSDSSWYWPGVGTDINEAAKNTIKPLVIDSRNE